MHSGNYLVYQIQHKYCGGGAIKNKVLALKQTFGRKFLFFCLLHFMVAKYQTLLDLGYAESMNILLKLPWAPRKEINTWYWGGKQRKKKKEDGILFQTGAQFFDLQAPL